MLKMDREGNGPEFDDRLIKLVKQNSAIYDVRHPHYRRTPVRMAIWDKIAKQLGAPSRFLQTKWKNIRYNYLQEQKCLETGTVNPNIRKRRFTEDLSFLKNTAYRRDSINFVKQNHNESDDSYNFLNSENVISASNTYEVIELDHSEDEAEEFLPNGSFLPPINDAAEHSLSDKYEKPDYSNDAYDAHKNGSKDLTSKHYTTSTSLNGCISPTNSPGSSRSSPLLTPLSSTTKSINRPKNFINGKNKLSEVTIQPISSASILKRQKNASPQEQVLPSSTESKAIPTSTQINSDPIEFYCLSLADSLRAMPRSERERVKYEFAKILKDAHYKDQL